MGYHWYVYCDFILLPVNPILLVPSTFSWRRDRCQYIAHAARDSSQNDKLKLSATTEHIEMETCVESVHWPITILFVYFRSVCRNIYVPFLTGGLRSHFGNFVGILTTGAQLILSIYSFMIIISFSYYYFNDRSLKMKVGCIQMAYVCVHVFKIALWNRLTSLSCHGNFEFKKKSNSLKFM